MTSAELGKLPETLVSTDNRSYSRRENGGTVGVGVIARCIDGGFRTVYSIGGKIDCLLLDWLDRDLPVRLLIEALAGLTSMTRDITFSNGQDGVSRVEPINRLRSNGTRGGDYGVISFKDGDVVVVGRGWVDGNARGFVPVMTLAVRETGRHDVKIRYYNIKFVDGCVALLGVVFLQANTDQTEAVCLGDHPDIGLVNRSLVALGCVGGLRGIWLKDISGRPSLSERMVFGTMEAVSAAGGSAVSVRYLLPHVGDSLDKPVLPGVVDYFADGSNGSDGTVNQLNLLSTLELLGGM